MLKGFHMKNTNKPLVIFAALLAITSTMQATLTPEQETAITKFHRAVPYPLHHHHWQQFEDAVDALPVIEGGNPFVRPFAQNPYGDITENILLIALGTFGSLEAFHCSADLNVTRIITKMLSKLATPTDKTNALLIKLDNNKQTSAYDYASQMRMAGMVKLFDACRVAAYFTEELKTRTQQKITVYFSDAARDELCQRAYGAGIFNTLYLDGDITVQQCIDDLSAMLRNANISQITIDWSGNALTWHAN